MSIESFDSETSEVSQKSVTIRKKWLEIVVYFVLLVATAFYANDAINLPNHDSSSSMGASGFPMLVSILIGALLVLLIIASILNKPSKENDSLVEINRPVKVLLSIIVMVAAVLTLEWLGPILGVAILSFLLMKLGGESRYSLLLMLPPLLALGIYAIFVLVLGVYFD